MQVGDSFYFGEDYTFQPPKAGVEAPDIIKAIMKPPVKPTTVRPADAVQYAYQPKLTIAPTSMTTDYLPYIVGAGVLVAGLVAVFVLTKK